MFSQLVVVGDQNTGKSSVLQAITEISFPVEETMCTRFPIKISFRQVQSKKTTVKASILHGQLSGRDDALLKRTSNFFMEREVLDSKAMEEIVREVRCILAGSAIFPFHRALTSAKATKAIFGEIQSLKPKANGNTASSQLSLSDATLYIERSGPDEMHWTIVDLPGLLQNGKQGGDWRLAEASPAAIDRMARSRSNAAIAEELVRTYLSNERNIVLLVSPNSTQRRR